MKPGEFEEPGFSVAFHIRDAEAVLMSAGGHESFL
jgi:hypothetical protein